MDPSRVVRIRRPPPTGDGPPYRWGSGYLVREGQVLTAAHVLIAADPHIAEDATDTVRIGDRCWVALWDALQAAQTDDDIRWLEAAVTAVDPTSDVAVIAVDGAGEGLPPVRLGVLEGDGDASWAAVGFPKAGLSAHGREPERARGTT